MLSANSAEIKASVMQKMKDIREAASELGKTMINIISVPQEERFGQTVQYI